MPEQPGNSPDSPPVASPVPLVGSGESPDPGVFSRNSMALPTLDVSKLEEMFAWTGENEQFLGELITTYLDDARHQLALMQQARHGQNMETLEDIAHSLKPTSATMGAMRMAALCERLESLAKRSRDSKLSQSQALGAQASQFVNAIVLEYQEVSLALAAYSAGN